MTELREGLRDLRSIVTDAGRVLRSSWPALATVFLIGFSLRSLFLYTAIQATKVAGWLGQLVYPLAPLGLLLALVVMLRIAWRTVPSHIERPQRFSRQLAEDLRLGTSLMIPFIAVYASAGLLGEDNLAFLRGIFLDELARNGILATDWARFNWLSGLALLAVVLLALTIRWTLIITGLPRRSWRWAALGAYVEALWVSTLAGALRGPLSNFAGWFSGTQLGELVLASYRALVGLMGPLEPIIRSSVSWLSQHLVAIAALVFLPLAWLAIGQTAADAEHERLPGQRQPSAWWLAWRARTAPVVERARRYRKVTQPAWEPVTDLITAVRHIVVAGWVPMVSFAVLFFLAGQLRVLVAFLGRLILGPQTYADFVATKPYVLMAELLVYLTVIVALITGAVRLVDAAFARATAASPAVGAPVPGGPVYGPGPGGPVYGAPGPGGPAYGTPAPGGPVYAGPAAPVHGQPPPVPHPQGGDNGNTATPGGSHHR